MPKAATSHDGPVLCSAWNHDGSAVFTGGCDKQAKRWDLATNQATQAPRLPPAAAPHPVPCSECPPWARAERTMQVAAHDAPVRHLAWVPELNMLVTGSWDKTLKYWDLRSQGPALQYQLPERLYAMSCVYPMLVVGTAERHIQARGPGGFASSCLAGRLLMFLLQRPDRCSAGNQPGAAAGRIQNHRFAAEVPDALPDHFPRQNRLPGARPSARLTILHPALRPCAPRAALPRRQ